MGKKYEKPPIVEALCEFRFTENPWRIIYPGLIYEQIKDDYPDDNPLKCQTLESGRIVIEDRFQFLKKDTTGIIQMNRHLLSIHVLNCYTSWNNFFPEIQRIFQIYKNIVKPQKLNRIGLRYVNKFDIDTKIIPVEHFFNFYPFLGKNLPQTHGQFDMNVLIAYEEERDFLKLSQKTIPPQKEDTMSILLDLDYFTTSLKGNINLKKILTWIDTAHENLERAFEGCITDELRKEFKEVK